GPGGSMGGRGRRLCSTRTLATGAARANAAFTSPPFIGKLNAWLVPNSGWTSGAPSPSARSGSETAGNDSYSTSISSAASRASDGLSATTAATGTPVESTTLSARYWYGNAFSPGTTARYDVERSEPRSFAVTTRSTPGAFRAASVRMAVIRA